MPGSGRKLSWSEFLDAEGQNKIFVRIVLDKGLHGVEEFAVIFLSESGGQVHEIVRYDCGRDEAIHIHRFYVRPAEKTYLNREKSFATIDEFMETIRKNWRVCLSRFFGG